jgi:hypothetical protein
MSVTVSPSAKTEAKRSVCFTSRSPKGGARANSAIALFVKSGAIIGGKFRSDDDAPRRKLAPAKHQLGEVCASSAKVLSAGALAVIQRAVSHGLGSSTASTLYSTSRPEFGGYCTCHRNCYDILNEKQPVTPAMALRLARMFGGNAESWTNLQRNYDLKIAEAELGDKLDAIPLLKAA